MRIFKTRTFNRWAKRDGLSNRELCRAIQELRVGLIDAHLGAGIIKKRIKRSGHGKRVSYRTLLATNQRDRWFFMFGFAKNERDNIAGTELEMLIRLATALLGMDNLKIEEALSRGELVEIDDGEQEIA